MKSSVQQQGLSLVELMVAIAISLVLSAAASYAYVAGVKIFTNTSGTRVLDQQAQFIMDLIGHNIRSAGTPFVDVSSTRKILDQVTNVPGPMLSSVTTKGLLGGCSYNAKDVNGYGWGATYCNSELFNSALQVQYYGDTNTKDCLGNAVPVVLGKPVINVFFVKAGSYVLNGQTRLIRELYCQGVSDATPQPLFKGVEQFNLTYGVASLTNEGVTQIKNVRQMSDADWQYVSRVTVCIVMRTDDLSAVSGAPVLTGCTGTSITDPGKYVWKKYISTFNVRNRVTSRSS